MKLFLIIMNILLVLCGITLVVCGIIGLSLYTFSYLYIVAIFQGVMCIAYPVFNLATTNY